MRVRRVARSGAGKMRKRGRTESKIEEREEGREERERGEGRNFKKASERRSGRGNGGRDA
eukprot:3898276-Rhodomonas_salina.1